MADLDPWEPDDDEEETTAAPETPGDADTDPTDDVTEEERAMIRQARESGLRPGELVSRARRDVERETSARRPGAAPPAAAPPAAAAPAGNLPPVVTREELRVELDRVRGETEARQRETAGMAAVRGQMKATRELGDATEVERLAIVEEVGKRMAKRAGVHQLDPMDFGELAGQIAQEVISETLARQRKRFGGSAASTEEIVEEAKTARQTTRPAKGATRAADRVSRRDRVERPPIGMVDEPWPSQAELEEHHQQNLKEAFAAAGGGR